MCRPDPSIGSTVEGGRKMAGDDAGTGASGADGLELSLCLGRPPAPAPAPARRNLTIVYGQRVLCAVDVAELQARAIISMANREITGQVEERDGGSSTARLDDQRGKGTPTATSRAHEATPASPDSGIGGPVPPAPAILGEQAGLSMKRSLQRFLEKRKARAAAAAEWPYGVPRPAQPPGP